MMARMAGQILGGAPLLPPTLTAQDRCDRCGAQAYIKATLPGIGDLLFCAHHGRPITGVLIEQGAVVIDESELLNA